jgi:hypothetical protein
MSPKGSDAVRFASFFDGDDGSGGGEKTVKYTP